MTEIRKMYVKDWNDYQHYKDRKPPWIKLKTDVFSNYGFSKLSDQAKLLLMAVWTIASQTEEGWVYDDFEYIKVQCHFGDFIKKEHWKELETKGFLYASEVLADCYQDAPPSVSVSHSVSESKKEIVKEKTKLPEPPDWVPADDWRDFVEHRKNKITQRAAELIFQKLSELRSRGDPPGEVLRQSIENGWQGIFPLKRDQNDKHRSVKTNIHQPSSAATESRRRGIADALARRMEASGRESADVAGENSAADFSGGGSLATMH